jgi:hypothetical protein
MKGALFKGRKLYMVGEMENFIIDSVSSISAFNYTVGFLMGLDPTLITNQSSTCKDGLLSTITIAWTAV